MARYRVLFWRHIPLGVKATDVNGVVRVNLPARFQKAFQEAVARRSTIDEGTTYTTSSFRWSEPEIREGSATNVANLIAQEIEAEWVEEKARNDYEE